MNEISGNAENESSSSEERMGKAEIGCLLFVVAIVSLAVILVMRMFIPEVGFWKAILYTIGFFAVIAVFAVGKILFSERVGSLLVGKSEKPENRD